VLGGRGREGQDPVEEHEPLSSPNQGSQNRYSSGFQIQQNRTGKPTKPTD
jgi:hypothetical protein